MTNFIDQLSSLFSTARCLTPSNLPFPRLSQYLLKPKDIWLHVSSGGSDVSADSNWKKTGNANKFTRRTESVRASLFFYFLYLLLSVRLFSLLPFFLSISPFVLLCPPLHLSLCFTSLPSLLSPLSLLPLSLAVDYFWAAWLISVGSQAQCQGKWNAYKEAKRQTETSKSSLVFFQPLSKTLRRSSVCNIGARVFRKFISAAK